MITPGKNLFDDDQCLRIRFIYVKGPLSLFQANHSDRIGYFVISIALQISPNIISSIYNLSFYLKSKFFKRRFNLKSPQTSRQFRTKRIVLAELNLSFVRCKKMFTLT